MSPSIFPSIYLPIYLYVLHILLSAYVFLVMTIGNFTFSFLVATMFVMAISQLMGGYLQRLLKSPLLNYWARGHPEPAPDAATAVVIQGCVLRGLESAWKWLASCHVWTVWQNHGTHQGTFVGIEIKDFNFSFGLGCMVPHFGISRSCPQPLDQQSGGPQENNTFAKNVLNIWLLILDAWFSSSISFSWGEKWITPRGLESSA